MKKKLPHGIRFALDFPDVVLAQSPAPGNNVVVVVQEVTRLLAFRPGAKGYGNSEHWPFDLGLAMTCQGYREGVRRASNNVMYDSSWRWHAQNALVEVDEFIANVQEMRKWALWYYGPRVYAFLLEAQVI